MNGHPVAILQIIDASGWLAVYDVGSGEVRQLVTRPLVCWALIQEAGDAPTRVIGLDADQVAAGQGGPARGPAGSAGRSAAFLGYAREGENLARFR